MEQHTPRPSIRHILQSDYVAILALVAPFAIWIMYFAIDYFNGLPGIGRHQPIEESTGLPFFLTLGIIVTVIGIPLFIWRVRSIQAVFSRGVEVPGQIMNVSFRRDRGRVEYTYVYQGQTFQGGNAISKTSRTKALIPGAQVVLVIDQDNPKRAFIRDLYV